MIRPFEEKDIGAVADIEKANFSEPWSEESLRSTLRSEFSHFAVFEEDGEICGYIGLYAVMDEGSITNVATRSDKRGQGIGKALVSYALEKGRELKLSFITLEVRESNSPAIALYEKCGFERMGVRRNFYSRPRENAVIMNYFYNKEKLI